jgi:hypothetical protein
MSIETIRFPKQHPIEERTQKSYAKIAHRDLYLNAALEFTVNIKLNSFKPHEPSHLHRTLSSRGSIFQILNYKGNESN